MTEAVQPFDLAGVLEHLHGQSFELTCNIDGVLLLETCELATKPSHVR